MGLEIGGYSLPGLGQVANDNDRFMALQLQAQHEADQLNAAQTSHTAQMTGENFAYHQQQDAIARQQQALAHQYAQQDFENQRQQAEFARQGTWHDQEGVAHDQNFARQGDWHAQELAHQQAVLAQNLDEFKDRQLGRQQTHQDYVDLHNTQEIEREVKAARAPFERDANIAAEKYGDEGAAGQYMAKAVAAEKAIRDRHKQFADMHNEAMNPTETADATPATPNVAPPAPVAGLARLPSINGVPLPTPPMPDNVYGADKENQPIPQGPSDTLAPMAADPRLGDMSQAVIGPTTAAAGAEPVQPMNPLAQLRAQDMADKKAKQARDEAERNTLHESTNAARASAEEDRQTKRADAQAKEVDKQRQIQLYTRNAAADVKDALTNGQNPQDVIDAYQARALGELSPRDKKNPLIADELKGYEDKEKERVATAVAQGNINAMPARPEKLWKEDHPIDRAHRFAIVDELEKMRGSVPAQKPITAAAPTGLPGNADDAQPKPVLVTSKAQYDALPSGTPVIDGHGKLGRKP